ncbi:MAG: hypothetical protein HYY46_17530 [Deltaproteobacteria bacterium]|nr:hypothetical protein [Deltaproteobacteria bacterium]
MTVAIADTDILSTFGKIGRMDLLQLLFQKVHVSPAVYRELVQAEKLFTSYPQISNTLGLSYLDLEEILRALKTKGILNTEALAQIIDQIEEKDHTRIKAKDQILSK